MNATYIEFNSDFANFGVAFVFRAKARMTNYRICNPLSVINRTRTAPLD